MKIACHILSYNVDLFIDEALKNSAPNVDKIYITYSILPWGYNKTARMTNRNPTTLGRVKDAILRLKAEIGPKADIEIIQGEWESEDETRNLCLDKATKEGFDWLIIQDADEFYSQNSWKMIKDVLRDDAISECIQTTWYTFWKSSHFVIQNKNGDIKSNNVCFALRCGSGKRFVGSRATTSDKISLIDAPCYHYSYVMSDDEMVEKVTTWGHAHQFDSRKWLRHKWFNWNLDTRNLHPLDPAAWRRVIRFPNEQPDFSTKFALPITVKRDVSLRDSLGNLAWDMNAEFYHAARKMKRSVVGKA